MSRRERLFLPAISLFRFSSHLPGILTGLLLIEMESIRNAKNKEERE
jgi:hypothetical protein